MIRAPAAAVKSTNIAVCKKPRFCSDFSCALHRRDYLSWVKTIKTFAFGFLIFPAMFLQGIAGDIKPGATMADVRSSMGVPRGEARVGDREIYYYDRGEVEGKSGVVTRALLRSEEEQSALEEKRSREADRLREEREIRQARLNQEGESLKAQKLADVSFLTSPLSRQAAFWQDFSRRYPGVTITEQLMDVRGRLALEIDEKLKQAAQAQRLADLEARVLAAENVARLGFTSSYAQYGIGGYHSFGNYFPRHPRDDCPAPTRVESVTRMYEFPLPYATSPGMPPMQPVYRREDLNGDMGRGGDANRAGYSGSSYLRPERF